MAGEHRAAVDGEGAGDGGQGRALLDIAVSRFRLRRRHPEGHEISLPGGFRGYFGTMSENLDQFKETTQKGDFKEDFDMGLEATRLPLGLSGSTRLAALAERLG